MEDPPNRRNLAAGFTDDLLVEILSRLPVRSLCRFKCVSRSWRNLISDPVHRKKLPHTLTGFFYHSLSGERFPRVAHHFTNVTGKGVPFIFPSFSFLPVPSDDVLLLDSCNGLLLCRCFEPDPRDSDGIGPFHYVVCNPATEKWVMLPDGSWVAGERRTARLGFDPTVSLHFHVIEYVVDENDCVTGVEIYSSRTAAWSFKESEWGNDIMLHDRGSVFLNGFMHMLTYSHGIIAVNMNGNTWRTIPILDDYDGGCIHQAQGRLCFFTNGVHSCHAVKLLVWILEDYGTDEWVLKHTVSHMKLFRKNNLHFDLNFRVITVHPQCNLIFFVFGWDKTLMAYEMDRKEVRVIRNLGHDCQDPYFPYIPLFSEALAEEQ
ncbi:hypothetical protein BS78_01G311700 [Paspalum vaginatum]|nr:hypothetical protein BS78_01G311700 [Paspalum vaginatum]